MKDPSEPEWWPLSPEWHKEPKTDFVSGEIEWNPYLVEEKCYLQRQIAFEGYNNYPSNSNSSFLEL